ncbi:MAG TPA: FmdE family protein [Isosphaeraceae bacterium]|nr:FmdE family protein [Isosphaeraceae bacterium]
MGSASGRSRSWSSPGIAPRSWWSIAARPGCHNSCLADGLQAATGASPGKLNLRVEEGPVDRLSTIVEDRKTGRRLTFTLRPEFVRSIGDVPRERLEEEGRRVATLADGDLFQLIIADPDRGRLPPPRGAWERGGNHPRAVPPPPVSD